jgi:hypothetical protein
MPALVSALNRVDLPTLGRPTMPHLTLMSFLKKQAHQCMRWAWGTALVVLLAPWAAWSQPATSPVVVLDERTNLIEGGQVTGWQWIDGLGTAALEQVLPGKASWQPLDPEAIHTLGAPVRALDEDSRVPPPRLDQGLAAGVSAALA